MTLARETSCASACETCSLIFCAHRIGAWRRAGSRRRRPGRRRGRRPPAAPAAMRSSAAASASLDGAGAGRRSAGSAACARRSAARCWAKTLAMPRRARRSPCAVGDAGGEPVVGIVEDAADLGCTRRQRIGVSSTRRRCRSAARRCGRARGAAGDASAVSKTQAASRCRRLRSCADLAGAGGEDVAPCRLTRAASRWSASSKMRPSLAGAGRRWPRAVGRRGPAEPLVGLGEDAAELGCARAALWLRRRSATRVARRPIGLLEDAAESPAVAGKGVRPCCSMRSPSRLVGVGEGDGRSQPRGAAMASADLFTRVANGCRPRRPSRP